MRIVLVALCALLIMNLSLEAKKRMPASQKTTISKEHKAMVKKVTRSRKAPRTHSQRVN